MKPEELIIAGVAVAGIALGVGFWILTNIKSNPPPSA